MAWNAIDMISIDDFEDQFRVPIGDQAHPPEEAPQEAVTAGTPD
jgi:hypothetical protein